jgi:hypothetical protein
MPGVCRGDMIIAPFLPLVMACVDSQSQRLDLGRLLVKYLKPLHSLVARQVIQYAHPSLT